MKTVAFLSVNDAEGKTQSEKLNLLNGKPLFLYALEMLVECSFIDEIYLDSEDDFILDYADYLKYKKMKRSRSSTDEDNCDQVAFWNEAGQIYADVYIRMFDTSPFIKQSTIKKTMEILEKQSEYDFVVTIDKQKLPRGVSCDSNSNFKKSIDEECHFNEFSIDDRLCVVRKNCLTNNYKRAGYNPYFFEVSPIEAISLKDSENFALADVVAKGLAQKEVDHFRILSKHLSSAILSDITFSLNLECVIAGLNCNLPNGSIMGRANTLKIRLIRKGENPNGIYKGLKTYSKIGNGEIIVVENECPDLAYFGNLNCNLSIRSGAIGTIIGGVTRDSKDVSSLNYPVFSKGYSCKDVRGRAVVDYHQRPISLFGVRVCPGDLVFADTDGVVIIPKKYEKLVLNKAFHTITQERKVLENILLGQDGFEIFQKEGAF